MGTTRVKVIDLSSDQKGVKTSRKHAQKITVAAKIKAEKIEKGITEVTEKEQESTEIESPAVPSVPSKPSVPSVITNQSKSKIAKKQKHHLGKKYQESLKLVDQNTNYSAKDAIELLRKMPAVKFDPTVELHINVTDKNIRGKVNLPHAVGGKVKEKKYLIFSDQKTDAKNVTWADEKTIAEIESGKLKPGRDFDSVVTTPKYMPHLAKVAKILGPKGMMPNPKNGTITDDVLKVLSGTEDSAYEFRSDPTAPIIHTKIGKLSYKDEQLSQNLKALIRSIGQSKIRKATVSSTMSPPIKIDIASVGK